MGLLAFRLFVFCYISITMNSISNLFSEKNADIVIGFTAILVVIWLVVFAIPALFVSLFNTILGNFILIGLVILTGMYSPVSAIGVAIIFFLLVRFAHMSA